VYHVKFTKLLESKRCKKFFDASSFYGGTLHISYAPEYETIDEIREKLRLREKQVIQRIKLNEKPIIDKKRTIDDLIESCVQNKRHKQS
jgi:hypothetical protein